MSSSSCLQSSMSVWDVVLVLRSVLEAAGRQMNCVWGSCWCRVQVLTLTPGDGTTLVCRLRPLKEMAQSHEYLSIEYSEEEVWLTWTDKNNEHHEKSVRQLAQEARAGNAHDENVLSYYRCPAPSCLTGLSSGFPGSLQPIPTQKVALRASGGLQPLLACSLQREVE